MKEFTLVGQFLFLNLKNYQLWLRNELVSGYRKKNICSYVQQIEQKRVSERVDVTLAAIEDIFVNTTYCIYDIANWIDHHFDPVIDSCCKEHIFSIFHKIEWLSKFHVDSNDVHLEAEHWQFEMVNMSSPIYTICKSSVGMKSFRTLCFCFYFCLFFLFIQLNDFSFSFNLITIQNLFFFSFFSSTICVNVDVWRKSVIRYCSQPNCKGLLACSSIAFAYSYVRNKILF